MTRPPSPLSARLEVRVTPEQLERWKQAAEADKRSLSSWVAIALDAAVQRPKRPRGP